MRNYQIKKRNKGLEAAKAVLAILNNGAKNLKFISSNKDNTKNL